MAFSERTKMVKYRVKEVNSSNYLGEYETMNEAGWFCDDMDKVAKKHGSDARHEVVEYTDRGISKEKKERILITKKELYVLVNWGDTINSDDNYKLDHIEIGLLRALKEKK